MAYAPADFLQSLGSVKNNFIRMFYIVTVSHFYDILKAWKIQVLAVLQQIGFADNLIMVHVFWILKSI